MRSARKKPWKQVKTPQGVKYKYDFQDQNWNIKRTKRTFNSAEEAQSFHDALLNNAMNLAKGEQLEKTFGDALIEYIEHIQKTSKLSLPTDMAHLNALRWPFAYRGTFYRLEELPLHDREFGIVWGIKKFKQDIETVTRRSYLNAKIYHFRQEPSGSAWYEQPNPSENSTPGARIKVSDPHTLKQLETSSGRGPFSSDTIKRRLSLAKTILHTAWYEWRWISMDLSSLIKLDKSKNGRIAFLSSEDLTNLINAADQFFGYLIRGAKTIGWRKSNLIGLTWDRVTFPEYYTDQAGNRVKIPGFLKVDEFTRSHDIDPMDLTQRRTRTKNKEYLETIMTEEIETLLREIYTHKHATSDVVFHKGNGEYWGDFRKRWDTAKKRAGIAPNFRWHDLRHTWATEKINEGVPEHIIMEEQGWKSPAMVKRYAHLKREARYAALKKAGGGAQ